jgi:hypothetical protein
METGDFSKHWMARGAPQEISRKIFQALENFAPKFPSLGKNPADFPKLPENRSRPTPRFAHPSEGGDQNSGVCPGFLLWRMAAGQGGLVATARNDLVNFGFQEPWKPARQEAGAARSKHCNRSLCRR